MKLAPIPRNVRVRIPLPWAETQSSRSLNAAMFEQTPLWNRCRTAVTASREECREGSWVIAQSPINVKCFAFSSLDFGSLFPFQQNSTVIGQIIELLLDVHGTTAIAMLDIFQVSQTRDEFFGMPQLTRRQGEISRVVVPVKVCSIHSACAALNLVFRTYPLHSMYSITVVLHNALIQAAVERNRKGLNPVLLNLSSSTSQSTIISSTHIRRTIHIFCGMLFLVL
jgi:hypothetical protein